MAETTNTITNWAQLEEFGICMLTGEACAYNMRILCDVNAMGAEVLATYYGIKPDAFGEPWNGFVNQQPSVGSVMIARNSFRDIAIFCLLHVAQWPVVTIHEDDSMFMGHEHAPDGSWQKTYGVVGMYTRTVSAAPRVGDRFIHVATGRAG